MTHSIVLLAALGHLGGEENGSQVISGTPRSTMSYRHGLPGLDPSPALLLHSSIPEDTVFRGIMVLAGRGLAAV
ncbi:MAG TPA: hypothetical protein EYP33_02800 [Pyrodictium sp.]|nr:hypothetical protein [Pyrodictium sp.]